MKYSITEIADILHIKEDRLNDQEAVVSQLLTDSRSLNYPKETLFLPSRPRTTTGTTISRSSTSRACATLWSTTSTR